MATHTHDKPAWHTRVSLSGRHVVHADVRSTLTWRNLLFPARSLPSGSSPQAVDNPMPSTCGHWMGLGGPPAALPRGSLQTILRANQDGALQANGCATCRTACSQHVLGHGRTLHPMHSQLGPSHSTTVAKAWWPWWSLACPTSLQVRHKAPCNMCDRSFGNNDTKLAQSVSSCPNPFQVDPGLLYQRMAASNPTDNKRQPWTVLVTKYRPVHNMGCHQHCGGSNTRPWSIPPAPQLACRTTYGL